MVEPHVSAQGARWRPKPHLGGERWVSVGIIEDTCTAINPCGCWLQLNLNLMNSMDFMKYMKLMEKITSMGM